MLDMTKDGVGVALGQRMMAANDLAAGKLVALSEITITLGEPYCFVSRKVKPANLGCHS